MFCYYKKLELTNYNSSASACVGLTLLDIFMETSGQFTFMFVSSDKKMEHLQMYLWHLSRVPGGVCNPEVIFMPQSDRTITTEL